MSEEDKQLLGKSIVIGGSILNLFGFYSVYMGDQKYRLRRAIIEMHAKNILHELPSHIDPAGPFTFKSMVRRNITFFAPKRFLLAGTFLMAGFDLKLLDVFNIFKPVRYVSYDDWKYEDPIESSLSFVGWHAKRMTIACGSAIVVSRLVEVASSTKVNPYRSLVRGNIVCNHAFAWAAMLYGACALFASNM